jgi:transketolase
MNINESNARLWSKFGPRAVYGQAMLELAEQSSDVLAMSADLSLPSGLSPFSRKYPKQFINTGIAEQNLIGVSAGLAKEGFIPFVSSFAPFVSMRASEQIRMELGYMQFNVKVVALGSGLAMSFLGNSHYGLEDIAVMRTIPGLTIVCPSDCIEVIKVVRAAAKHKGPMYIRLTGAVDNPIVNTNDYEYEIGKAIRLRKGDDIVIVSTGSMVSKSLDAAKILAKKDISVEVVNMHTIKPLDVKTLKEIVNSGKPMVSIEEHTVVGGLGSAIAEYLTTLKKKIPHKIIGLKDEFGKTAEYDHLIKLHGLDGSSIAQKVEYFMNSNK